MIHHFLHGILPYYVGILGAFFIVAELLEKFVLMPPVRDFMRKTAKDVNDKKWAIDQEKFKELPKVESFKVVAIGCFSVVFAFLYYAWIVTLLFSPVCFWFAIGLVSLVLALTVSAKAFGVMSKTYEKYKYVDTFLTVLVILAMIFRVIATR